VATRSPIRLTELSHGAGCGCKIAPDQLAEVLARFPAEADPNLLVGSEGSDDAAVYRIGGNRAIVHTADFFTPIVDDPYDFGRIAATNALSDVYAMGGTPLVALNLVAFSLDDLGADVLERILRGGRDAVHGAGAVIGGGHSIEDAEPKYGLAVTGLVDPERMLTNDGGRAGDTLVLTKPLGAGLIATATKRGIAGAGLIARAVDVMTTLNADAARSAVDAGASAATDVTGFGLLGHAHELALASGVRAELDAAAVPAIDGALELAEGGDAVAGGTQRNARHAAAFTEFRDSVPDARRTLCADAMTSGGLLVAIEDSRASEIPGTVVGRLTDGEPGAIEVR
jgi:selenide,water dikinase